MGWPRNFATTKLQSKVDMSAVIEIVNKPMSEEQKGHKNDPIRARLFGRRNLKCYLKELPKNGVKNKVFPDYYSCER